MQADFSCLIRCDIQLIKEDCALNHDSHESLYIVHYQFQNLICLILIEIVCTFLLYKLNSSLFDLAHLLLDKRFCPLAKLFHQLPNWMMLELKMLIQGKELSFVLVRSLVESKTYEIISKLQVIFFLKSK